LEGGQDVGVCCVKGLSLGREFIEERGTSRAQAERVCLEGVCQQFLNVRISRKSMQIKEKIPQNGQAC